MNNKQVILKDRIIAHLNGYKVLLKSEGIPQLAVNELLKELEDSQC